MSNPKKRSQLPPGWEDISSDAAADSPTSEQTSAVERLSARRQPARCALVLMLDMRPDYVIPCESFDEAYQLEYEIRSEMEANKHDSYADKMIEIGPTSYGIKFTVRARSIAGISITPSVTTTSA